MTTERLAAMWTMCQMVGWPLGLRTSIVRDPAMWNERIGKAKGWILAMQESMEGQGPDTVAQMLDEIDMVKDCIAALEGGGI